jgi:predicted nucleic acid-binding protein
MSGKTFLLDTNIIIHLSYGELNTSDFSSSGDRLCISAITYMEALGYPFKTKEDESFVKMLCNSFDLLDLTKPIIEKTIEIRKKSKIKLPDAIIAASALVNNAALVTNNVKDFKTIDGISIINPIPD